jgi:hypothetical protein
LYQFIVWAYKALKKEPVPVLRKTCKKQASDLFKNRFKKTTLQKEVYRPTPLRTENPPPKK